MQNNLFLPFKQHMITIKQLFEFTNIEYDQINK